MPGAIYTNFSHDAIERSFITKPILPVIDPESQSGVIHIRSDFSDALGYRVNGFPTTDVFDSRHHIQLPHRAIASVLLQEGGSDTRTGNHVRTADIQTKQGGTSWFAAGSIFSDMPAKLLRLPSYGKHVFDGEVSGPIIPQKLYMYSAAEYESFDDADPSVVGVPRYTIAKGSRLYDHDNNNATASIPIDTVLWGNIKNGARPNGSNALRRLNAYARFTAPLDQNLNLEFSGTFSQMKRNWFNMFYLLSPYGVPRSENTAWDIQSSVHWRVDQQLSFSGGLRYYVNKETITNRKLSSSDSYALRHLQDSYRGRTGFLTYMSDNLFYDVGAGYGMFIRKESSTASVSVSSQYMFSNTLFIESGVSYTSGIYRSATIYDSENLQFGSNDIFGYSITDDFKLKKKNSGLDGVKKPTLINAYGMGNFKMKNFSGTFGLHVQRLTSGTRELRNLHDPSGMYNDVSPGVLDEKDFYSHEYTTILFLPRLGVNIQLNEMLSAYSHYGWYSTPGGLQRRYVGSEFLEKTVLAPSVETIIGNSKLKPVESELFDLGARVNFSSPSSMGAQFYIQEIKNIVDYTKVVAEPNGYISYYNGPKAGIVGFAADITLIPHENFFIIWNYGAQTSEFELGSNVSSYHFAWLGFNTANFAVPVSHVRTWQFGQQATLHFDNSAAEPLLKGTFASMEWHFKDGSFYTPTTMAPIQAVGYNNQYPVSKKNSSETGSLWTIDIKAGKSFVWKNHTATLFIECTNLYNNKNPTQVFSSSGKPDDNGFLDSPYFLDYQKRIRPQYKAHFRNGLMYEPGRELRMGIEISM